VNATFLITLLITAGLFFSLGFFLASVALSRSIRDDIAGLEAERHALDEEREMLTRFWAMDVQPPHVEMDLDGHKRLDRVLS
jgi:hypothetical protein